MRGTLHLPPSDELGLWPAGDRLGPHAEKFVNPPAETVVNPPNEKFVNPPAEFAVEPATAPTVVRTVVKEEAVRALPIALAGAALLIATAGPATC